MRILVIDIAAESSGALSVLEEFHQHVLQHCPEHEWVFLLSKAKLEQAPHVKTLHYEWVKKSWFHRLAWDNFALPRVIREQAPDIVLSLQNMAAKRTKQPQAVYLHNALPFQRVKKFSFFKRDERKFAIYQQVIGRLITSSLQKAKLIIVQTDTMRQSVLQHKPGLTAEFFVAPTQVELPDGLARPDNENWHRTFLYPATPFLYKDHQSIIDATKQLVAQGITDFRVLLTFTGQESPFAAALAQQCKGVEQIELIGYIPRQELYELYTNSTLLMTSYCESYAVPLAEARKLGQFVVAADVPYAREALQGYPNVLFSQATNAQALSQSMKQVIEWEAKKIPFIEGDSEAVGWSDVVQKIIALAAT